MIIVATLLFFWLALDSMIGDSPTMDEQNHLARGLAFLHTGDPRLSLEHPPLVNTLSALPLLTIPDIRLPTDHPSWERHQGWYEFAELLLWHYNQDVTRMIFLARLPIVLLTLGLALLSLHVARVLWGRLAATLAFILILFDPNILAHGRYATTDVGGALFVFLAAFAVWRLWREPELSWSRLAMAGAALGLAYGSKLSALAFGPLFALLAFVPLFHTNVSWLRAGLQRFLHLALAHIPALFVVWAVFGWQWGPLNFASTQLNSLSGVPGPMPTFWAGLEQILLLSEGGRPSFLLGATSIDGFRAYFPVAFLVKTPLPTLVLLVAAVVLHIAFPWRAGDRRKALYLLLPPAIYFVLSMQSALNIGYRHLMPMLPFIYVAGAGAAARFAQRYAGRPDIPARSLLAAIYAASPVAALVVATTLLHPHYLSFFNIVGGGPANGYQILVDSNVDWGQDLLRLQQWLDENDVQRPNFSWFGSADPAYYGIAYNPLPGLPRHFDLWWDAPFDPGDPAPGIYAISVSNLWELPLQEKTVFPWFRQREPDHRIGYSIFIYDVR